MSTELIYASVCTVISRRLHDGQPGKSSNALIFLDVGAGWGQLITRMKERFAVTSHACDYIADKFDAAGVEMLEVNLNQDPLLYPDSYLCRVSA